MRLYQGQHRAYCGVDLHARTMYLCVLDHDGRTLLHEDIPATKDGLPRGHRAPPRRPGRRLRVHVRLVLAGRRLQGGRHPLRPGPRPGHAGHPRHQDQERQGRLREDRPPAPHRPAAPGVRLPGRDAGHPRPAATPRPPRAAAGRGADPRPDHPRAIQRRRRHRQAPLPANRAGVLDRFEDEAVRRTLGVDLALAEHLDGQIAELEAYLAAQAKVHDLPNFYRLRSIPGVGKVLALTILYEVGDIRRFDDAGQFLSYARLVRPAKESAGKRVGPSNRKMGNAPPEVGLPRGRRADDPARARGQGVRGRGRPRRTARARRRRSWPRSSAGPST